MSERGHCKYRLEDEQGKVCYAGALMLAIWGNLDYTGVHDWQGNLFDDVVNKSQEILTERDYFSELTYPHFKGTFISRDPVTFNNDERTTAEDVVLLLKLTAERLEDAA
jgi:hypothetical protein